MAIPAWAPTMVDLANRMDPNGNIANIIEMLNLTNPIVGEMPMVESNQTTSHITTVRAGLPDVAWRKLNYGTKPSKSRTARVTDGMGMLQAWAEVDKELVRLNGNSAAFRLSEDRAFIEAMNQEAASGIFYGDTTVDPEKFNGLSMRYNALSNAENAQNILSAGGSSNCTSVWLVVWGDNTIHGLYPKGTEAGLHSRDLGEVTLTDDNGGLYQGYRTLYQWGLGLTVRDWRYAVRIANIDTTALEKNPGALATDSGGDLITVGGPDLIDLLTQALEIVPSLGAGRPVIYANRTITGFLRRQIVNKVAHSTLTMDTVAGKRVLAFDNVPVSRTDALINNEAVVA